MKITLKQKRIKKFNKVTGLSGFIILSGIKGFTDTEVKMFKGLFKARDLYINKRK